jgi:ABC-type nitrate/sulfonate/bicarbonate transport system substrate-binding protein
MIRLSANRNVVYAKSLAYTENDIIPDDAVDALFTYIDEADKGGALWFIIWDLEGGATNDVAPDATAYGHRNALFYHQAYAVNLLGKVSEVMAVLKDIY